LHQESGFLEFLKRIPEIEQAQGAIGLRG
jgi:hypothetical protein